ncbi:chitinase 1 [Umbelopsis sp. PMI_123]|nr:chitinase 1 [Umbelopsis sp. PMI_123]
MVSSNFVKTALGAAVMFASSTVTSAFSATGNGNYVLYWGQNSYGAAGGASSGWQKNLASYCTDSTTDIFVLAFLNVFFSTGNDPALDFANASNNCTTFSGTNMLHCPQIGQDIKTCQANGKKILLSLGGASGSYGFTSDAQGSAFADQLWNLFGGGSSSTRPFDTAIVDGFDLDIEGGSSTGYAAFVTQMRTHYSSDTSKSYYISGAPQCPFPDAYLGAVLNSAWFDFVWVQFYNNYCSVQGGSFNFDTWNTWATGTSINKNVRIFIGVPGSTTAAGSGYVSLSALESTISSVRSSYSSFGGVMMWDASQAYGNTDGSPNYATAVGAYLHSGSTGGGTTTTTTTTKATTTTTGTKTTTTTTTSATATSTGTCPVNGAACSTSYGCAGTQYAQCANGVWVLQSCPSGLICQMDSTGGSVYCDYASGHTEICAPTSNAAALFASNQSNESIPATASKAAIVSFSVGAAGSDATTFEALFNVHAKGSKPIGNNWTLTFTMPKGQTVSTSNVGTVSQKGTVVTIKANRKKVPSQSESIVVGIKGKKSASGVFVGVDPSTINFKY